MDSREVEDRAAPLLALLLVGRARSDDDVVVARRNHPGLDRLLARTETQKGGYMTHTSKDESFVLRDILGMVRTMSEDLSATIESANAINRTLDRFQAESAAFWAEYYSKFGRPESETNGSC